MGHDAGGQPAGAQAGHGDGQRDDEQQRSAGELEVGHREQQGRHHEGHPAGQRVALQRPPQQAPVDDLLAQRRQHDDDEHDGQRRHRAGAQPLEHVADRGAGLLRPDEHDVEQRRRDRDHEPADPVHDADPHVVPRPDQAEVGARAVAPQPGDEHRDARREHRRHGEGDGQRGDRDRFAEEGEPDQQRHPDEHGLDDDVGADPPPMRASRGRGGTARWRSVRWRSAGGGPGGIDGAMTSSGSPGGPQAGSGPSTRHRDRLVRRDRVRFAARHRDGRSGSPHGSGPTSGSLRGGGTGAGSPYAAVRSPSGAPTPTTLPAERPKPPYRRAALPGVPGAEPLRWGVGCPHSGGCHPAPTAPTMDSVLSRPRAGRTTGTALRTNCGRTRWTTAGHRAGARAGGR